MDWKGLICNLLALAAGFGVYVGIANSKWKRLCEEYQYGVMLGCLLFACVVGGILRWLL